MHGLYGFGAIVGKHVFSIPVWQTAGMTVWFQHGSVASTTLPVTVEWDVRPMAECALSAAIGKMSKDAAALAEE